MDIEARPIGGDAWQLVDLLGRSVGKMIRDARGVIIQPTTDLLSSADQGPHASLDLALVEIGKRARGVCRLHAIKD